jgi:hypothetical protein
VSESTPKAVVPPRWIVHSDGRVSEFEPSQLAADLYRARCSHQRQGAALFAAELSAAVMHFAGREFSGPVWRADRLNKLTADLLRELGHAETADAWLQRSAGEDADDRAMAYSPDLVGLVEEGVLDFDLRLEGARPSLNIVDALDHVGLAQSSAEFLAGLRPVLSAAAEKSERVLVHGACQGAAFLHRHVEDPKEAAATLLDVVAETIASTLTPIALDLRWQFGSEADQRLSGGPLFPFDPPTDHLEFLRSLIEAIPSQIGKRTPLQLPLCVVRQTAGWGYWIPEWRSQGADRTASLILGLTHAANETSRETEIVVHLPKTKELTQQDVGILSAAVRAAAQRHSVLQRLGLVDDGRQPEAVFYLGVGGAKKPRPERVLEQFATSYGMSIRIAAPCRVWWSEGIADFCRWGPRVPRLGDEIWYVSSNRPRSSYNLIPRRNVP